MIAALILAAVGFVDLPHAIASHPLYPAVLQYDREIAALRETQHVPGLEALPAAVGRNSAQMQNGADAAAGVARRSAAQNGDAYRTREQNLLAGMQTHAISRHDAAGYRVRARQSADATLNAYRAAMAQRTQRALAARAQQFREKEATLAFDLEKRDAGRRLLLQVKLRDLHLDSAVRAGLQRRLDALDAAVRDAVAARQRADDGDLAAYAEQLRGREAADDARMAADVERSTSATSADGARLGESLPPEAAALRGYDAAAATSSIASNVERAGRDLGARFAQLQGVARTSDADTAARIAAIEATRRAVYGAIVDQIRNGAARVARERHIATIEFGSKPPKGAVDLTPFIPLPF